VESGKQMLQESLQATITRKIGYVPGRGPRSRISRSAWILEYGGALLLGVRGVCVICHGSSNANAIKNAIRVAAEFATTGLTSASKPSCAVSTVLREAVQSSRLT